MDNEIKEYLDKKFTELRIDLTVFINTQLKAEISIANANANKIYRDKIINERINKSLNEAIKNRNGFLRNEKDRLVIQYKEINDEIKKESKRTNKIIHTLRMNFSLIRSLASKIDRFYKRSNNDLL